MLPIGSYAKVASGRREKGEVLAVTGVSAALGIAKGSLTSRNFVQYEIGLFGGTNSCRCDIFNFTLITDGRIQVRRGMSERQAHYMKSSAVKPSNNSAATAAMFAARCVGC